MRTIFAVLLYATGISTAFAQDLRTVYYSNGKKAMEGHWTYTSDAYFSTNLLSKSDLRHRDTSNSSQQIRRGARHYQIGESIFLNLYCEGLVKTWYESGPRQYEITFKAGIAAGPYRLYYTNGQVAEEGTLVNGMPDGDWKQYNRDGSLNLSGAYQVRSQDSLEKKWNRIFLRLNPEPREYSNKYEPRPPLTEKELEQGRFESYIRNISGFLVMMEDYTENESFRNGTFLMFYPDRSPFTKAQYRLDVREGDWEWYNRPGHRAVTLSYKHGEVISVTDSNGRKLPVREAHAAYEEAIKKARSMPQPNAVFKYVEQFPTFKGDLQRYLADHLKYPAGDEPEGKVYVQFIVRQDGTITDAGILRSSGSVALDKEAVRVVRGMPAWNPGKNNGQAVASYFTLPVIFIHQ